MREVEFDMENNTVVVEEVSGLMSAINGAERILWCIIFSVIAIIVARLIDYMISRVLRRTSQKVGAKFTPLMCGFVVKVVHAFVWVITILIVLQIWGINLAPVIAGLGVAGVVLGFALQESIGSIFSGLILAVNNPFGIGDWVDCGDPVVSGTVVGMDAFSVTLVTGDNKKITISNKSVVNAAITNYSAFDKRRVDMVVQVEYGSDIAKAIGVINGVLDGYSEVDQEKKPVVQVSALDSSSVNIIVRPWVPNSEYWNVYWRFQKDIYAALEAAGIGIPFNQLDVHIHKEGE